MTVSLTHSFTNPKADGGDTTIVRPSDWNAEHVITMATSRLLGRTTASTGAVEEISVSADLSLASGTLSLGAGVYKSGGTDVALADGGTGASLTDPGADRILFWDDSAGAMTWLTAGTTLAISTTTLDVASGIYRSGGTDVALADGGTGASLSDPGADRVMFWDDSAGAVTWLTMGTNLTITDTTLDATGGGSSDPASDDGDTLGTTSFRWSDLFLAPGAVINFASGDITWTHSSGGVTQDGGYFQVKNADLASTHAIYVVNNVNTATASVAVFEGDRSAPTNNDQAHIDLRLSDSAGNQDVFARIKWLATDVTSTSEDGWMYFGVTTAGTYADELILSGTALFPQTTGGLALGTSSLGFSDIHLSTGADINWNSGESRIIQSTPNYMYFDGACFEYNYNDATTFGAIVYMQASEDVAYQNILSIGHDRATPTANDSASISLRLADSTGTATSFGRIQWQGTTITAGSEECTMYLRTSQAGIMRDALTLSKNNVAATTNAGANVVAIGLTNYLMQTTDYTLSSVGTEQKLFNQTTNGTLTLPLGVYEFECFLYLTTMSATSGNYAFDPIGAGTAVTDRWGQYAIGIDNTTPLSAGAWSGSASVTQQTVASAVTAGTGTGAVVTHKGMFRITTGGTIIPSITLVTANAAVVKAGSYFKITKFGDSNATVGAWT
jgi:hypothetical protein